MRGWRPGRLAALGRRDGRASSAPAAQRRAAPVHHDAAPRPGGATGWPTASRCAASALGDRRPAALDRLWVARYGSLPPFASRKHLPSRLATLRQLDGRSAVRIRGQGTEFDSLRDYVEGDDVRSIDWRATARRQHVVVRTWQPERDRRVVLVLDTSRTSAGRVEDMPRLDSAMDAALLLAALASRAGDRVDLIAGDRWVRARVDRLQPLHAAGRPGLRDGSARAGPARGVVADPGDGDRRHRPAPGPRRPADRPRAGRDRGVAAPHPGRAHDPPPRRPRLGERPGAERDGGPSRQRPATPTTRPPPSAPSRCASARRPCSAVSASPSSTRARRTSRRAWPTTTCC